MAGPWRNGATTTAAAAATAQQVRVLRSRPDVADHQGAPVSTDGANVVQIVRTQPPDPLAVSRDAAVAEIERELGHHLALVERVSIENVLDRFANAVGFHRSYHADPWC
jgi:hypothetical protein